MSQNRVSVKSVSFLPVLRRCSSVLKSVSFFSHNCVCLARIEPPPKDWLASLDGEYSRTPESPLRGRSTDRKVNIRIIFQPNSMSLYGLWELPHFFEVFIRIMRTTSRKNREKSEKIEKKSYFLIIAYHGD